MWIRLRRLRCDGHSFTWRAEIRHVQGSGDCHRAIRVRAWGAGKTGRAVQADLLSRSWPAPWGACAADDAYPTPADVRAIIGFAWGAGWDPSVRGGTFVLSERLYADSFVLPGFLLTDRVGGADGGDPTSRVIAAHEQDRAS